MGWPKIWTSNGSLSMWIVNSDNVRNIRTVGGQGQVWVGATIMCSAYSLYLPTCYQYGLSKPQEKNEVKVSTQFALQWSVTMSLGKRKHYYILHSACEKQNREKALHCIVYYNYWGVRSQIKKPILRAYTYGTTESVLLQLTPLLHQIFLQTIFDPGVQKENINMICDLQTPCNWTGVKIRYVHSTNTQGTDSLPIFP